MGEAYIIYQACLNFRMQSQFNSEGLQNMLALFRQSFMNMHSNHGSERSSQKCESLPRVNFGGMQPAASVTETESKTSEIKEDESYFSKYLNQRRVDQLWINNWLQQKGYKAEFSGQRQLTEIQKDKRRQKKKEWRRKRSEAKALKLIETRQNLLSDNAKSDDPVSTVTTDTNLKTSQKNVSRLNKWKSKLEAIEKLREARLKSEDKQKSIEDHINDSKFHSKMEELHSLIDVRIRNIV